MGYFRAYQRWYEESFSRYISTGAGATSKLNLIRSPWFALCFIVLLSMTLALVNSAWMFTPAGYLDAWLYVGYGTTFDDRNFGGALRDGYYKISRVLWLFLQYSVRKFFSPLSASYILQYSCLWLGTFSVYFTIRRLLGHVPALIAGVFLCIYQPFLGSGGADYHNTLVGPLYALSFLILTIAAQKEKHVLRWLILFGCVYGMTAHTQILYLNFAPILLMHFYAVRKVFCKEKVSFIKFISASLLGLILATVICGFISWRHGYPFLFFLPQFTLTERFLYGSWAVSPWWKPWNEWVLNAYHLAPLAAMMVFAVGSLFFWRKSKHQPVARLAHHLHLQYVVIGAVWLFWQLLKKDTLNTNYFAYPLIIPFAISVAASFSLRLSNQYLPIILGGVAFIAISLKAQLSFPFLFQIPPFILSFLLFSGVLCLLFFYKRGSIFAVALLAVASIFPVCYQSGPFSVRDGYLAIAEASQWLYNAYGSRRLPIRAKNIFIWFDEKAPQNPRCPLSNISYSLTNTMFDYLHSAFPMPSIQDLKLEELQLKLAHRKTKVVVLVTENESHVKEMQNRLEQMGISLDLVQFREIHVNSVRIPLYVLKG